MHGLHLPFVSHGFRRYLMTDINQESLRMAKERAADKQGLSPCELARPVRQGLWAIWSEA
jgi:hypothetical protein